MSKIKPETPAYRLKEIKDRIRSGKIEIKPNATESAFNDFGWEADEIIECLLKLKGSHFYINDFHDYIPDTMMDIYKAEKIMEDQNVYTHFYVDSKTDKVIVSSFKRK